MNLSVSKILITIGKNEIIKTNNGTNISINISDCWFINLINFKLSLLMAANRGNKSILIAANIIPKYPLIIANEER